MLPGQVVHHVLSGQVVQCVTWAGSAVCYLGSQCSVLPGQVVQRVTWAGSAVCYKGR